jgi:epoxide hydrolase-like predicted phosphatase
MPPVETTRTVRPRAAVFDFGGVIITPITTGVGVLAERHRIDPAVMLEVLLGPRASGDHPWHRAERGELEVSRIQQMLVPYADEVGVTLHGDEIDVLMAGGYTYNASVLERLVTLRAQGVATALLTNTFAEFRPTLERDLDLGLFDVVVESYAVEARKPEPAIYEATADALGVDHSAIVYLDDFDQNLEPAASLGWHTIHVVDPVDALAELDALIHGSP